MTRTSEVQVQRSGMFATVRNRRGLTTGVEPFDGPAGRLHLVSIDYKDDQLPRGEKLIWELEPAGRLLEPTSLPQVGRSDPMPVEDYDALLRATRWSAAMPFRGAVSHVIGRPKSRRPVSGPCGDAQPIDS